MSAIQGTPLQPCLQCFVSGHKFMLYSIMTNCDTQWRVNTHEMIKRAFRKISLCRSLSRESSLHLNALINFIAQLTAESLWKQQKIFLRCCHRECETHTWLYPEIKPQSDTFNNANKINNVWLFVFVSSSQVTRHRVARDLKWAKRIRDPDRNEVRRSKMCIECRTWASIMVHWKKVKIFSEGQTVKFNASEPWPFLLPFVGRDEKWIRSADFGGIEWEWKREQKSKSQAEDPQSKRRASKVHIAERWVSKARQTHLSLSGSFTREVFIIIYFLPLFAKKKAQRKKRYSMCIK